ncbi:MAG: hypothetical protein HOO96_37705 [Polyangiaceae bacterium]|nr:hypothetical protein [Polyangiaceae bacterium]
MMEDGPWILVNVFDDDAAAARDGRSKNTVRVTLWRRAGVVRGRRALDPVHAAR